MIFYILLFNGGYKFIANFSNHSSHHSEMSNSMIIFVNVHEKVVEPSSRSQLYTITKLIISTNQTTLNTIII
jgi:hypothetical protein